MKIFLKLLTLWAFVINSAFGQGDPAPFVKGMGSTGLGNSASTILVPNNQSTKINAYQALVETGNTNLLVNSGFEHSTPTTGWTLTNATAAVNTTNKLEGAKSLQVTPTVAGGGIKQIITLNASNLLGSQGVIEVPVRTSGTDVKVCFLANSVRTYCKDVPAFDSTSAFKTIVTPITFDGTSNGIEIYSTGTSVFIVDEIKIGRGLPLQNVNGAKLVGGVTITGCAGRFQTTSTTFASFGTQTGCVYTTFGQAVQPSVTNLPVIKFASLPAGDYIVEYTGAIFNATTGNNTWVKFHDGTGYMREEPWLSLGTSGGGGMAVSGSFSYATTQSNITFEARAKVQNGTGNLVGTTSEPGVIKVYYFPPESKIYTDFNSGFAENAGEIFATAQTSCPVGTLPADGSAVSRTTYAELFKNIGTTYGVGDGSTTFNVPNAKGVFIRGAGSQTISSITYTGTQGTTQGDQVQGHQHQFQTSSQGFASIAARGNDATLSTQNTNAIVTDGTNGTPRVGPETRPANISALYCIRAYNKNIVGSFAGIEKCANDYECTDTFSASIADTTATVSNENIDWISSCTNTGTGLYTCNLNANLKDGVNGLSSPMNCIANVSVTNNNTGANAYQVTTTQVFVSTFLSSTGALNNRAFTLKCQKGTNDYRPKTAKVASSIGVPTFQNTTLALKECVFDVSGAVDTFTTCTVNGTCSISKNWGNCISPSGVTNNGSGTFTINFNTGYWTSATTYQCFSRITNWQSAAVASILWESAKSQNQITALLYNSSGTTTNGAFTYRCVGY